MSGGRTVLGLVSAVRPAGALDVVRLSVPSDPAWGRARPGQLVVVPGDPGGGEVLPAVRWLAGVDVDPVHGTSVELVVPEADGYAVGTRVRLLGPLGRGFALPAQPVPVLVVAHQAAAAPVRWLVELLRPRGCPTHVVLSTEDPDLLADPGPLRRAADTVVLTRPEDLAGAAGRAASDCDAAVVLVAAPPALAREVVARTRGRVVRVAPLDTEGPVVCGTGLCGGCDLPPPGLGERPLRVCLEGPVLAGDRLEALTDRGVAAPGVAGTDGPRPEEVRRAAR